MKFYGVPRDYNAEDVAAEVLARLLKGFFIGRSGDGGCGGAVTFDFVHVPMSRSLTANLGMAIVNFVDGAVAAAAVTAMDGRLWSWRPQEIRCKPAHVQGLGANLFHLAAATSTHTNVFQAPIVYDKGRRIDFLTAIDRFAPQALSFFPMPSNNAPPVPGNLVGAGMVASLHGMPGKIAGVSGVEVPFRPRPLSQAMTFGESSLYGDDCRSNSGTGGLAGPMAVTNRGMSAVFSSDCIGSVPQMPSQPSRIQRASLTVEPSAAVLAMLAQLSTNSGTAKISLRF
eukprot:CAMPEP_0170253718 /NCGR_PEP_ID=MMETSP0116_2-20130129/26702_1 /TAXON_ID=400756 /ORGANISM="Durinskia baltica, Strain CSIRO CS-38" /LENGTH=283 /DNA_ID=CAMNT_0010504707 /DNA_START=76 /DNA_END=927 /DNA_ORIENTATION=-